MRLLLTHGYFLASDPKELQVMRPYPPLGLLYLSAYLRARGHDVEVFDSTFATKQDLWNRLGDGPPAWLGVYGNLMTRGNVLEIVERGRAAGWTVVAGGPEPANYAAEYLGAGANYVVPGEGELVMEQLLSGALPPGVLRLGGDGSVHHGGTAPLIRDLDSLPWPDRERIDLDAYLRAWRTHHGRSSVSVITARGCPFQCRWCSHSTFGQTHRRRSPAGVADEVAWVMNRYAPDMLWYADDVFTIHHGWIRAYAAEMKRRRLRIPFECITRADRLNEEMADTLAELGCFRVWIGSESGSQRILDAMQRGVTVAQVQAATRLVAARGIEAGMFLMWGYEGEEIDDIEATVRHVEACRPSTFLTTVSYPIKGTPYHAEVADRLVRIGEWRDSSDRDLRIRGRHSRRFYQHADELLRSSMAPHPDPSRVEAARAALRATYTEVEV
jgi:anaerobic magnesium-protoporphyrin IX monomethyl ester cyclase